MGRPRKAAEKPAEPEHTEDQWGEGPDEATERSEDSREAEDEAAEADEADESEDGEGDGFEPGEGEGDPAEDFAAMSRTDYPDDTGPEDAFTDEKSGDGLVVGSALSPRQQAGIDPVNAARNAGQHQGRGALTNAQTDHERENALDSVSGTANPGITAGHRHSAPGLQGATDMSGGFAKPDPLKNPTAQVSSVMSALSKESRKAISAGKRGHGYVSLKDLGVHKAVMDGLVKAGHVTQAERPGAHLHPETGTVYRLASHQEPEPGAED